MGDPSPPANPGPIHAATPEGSGSGGPGAPTAPVVPLAPAPGAKPAEAAPVEKLERLWARVKEHKIIQWTLAYLAAALALAHGAELVGHAFEWPDIVSRVVVILLVLGLPFAVTLAWYHGDRGIKRVSGAELTIIALLLFIGAGLFFALVRPSAEHAETPAPQSPPHIAVAPSPREAVENTIVPVAPAAPGPMRLPSAAGKPRIAILALRESLARSRQRLLHRRHARRDSDGARQLARPDSRSSRAPP